MTEPSNIAKVDLDSITEFQRRLHEPDPNNKNEGVDSFFSYNLKKISWSAQILAMLPCRQETADPVALVYTADPNMDFLLYSYFHQLLPALKVTEKMKNTVRICWPSNLPHSIFNHGQVCADNAPIQTLDTISMDCNSQYYARRGAGKREHYEMSNGNVPFLQEWGTFLPECEVLIAPPWFYCEHEVLAVKLFTCSKSSITHRINLKNKIKDLLRMQAYNSSSDKWEDIPFNFKYIEGLISAEEKLPIPTMWGCYTKTTDQERAWLKTKPNHIYFRDWVAKSSVNSISYDEVGIIDLHSVSPALAIFWMAENLDSTKNRNFSNYSTDSQDMTKGWNPIQSIKLNYGGISRLPEMNSFHFDKAEPLFKFPSSPFLPGYNAYSLAYDSTNLNADIGIVFKGLDAKLFVKMGNTDPFLRRISYQQSPGDQESDDSTPEEFKNSGEPILRKKLQGKDNFLPHVRLLVLKKLQYNKDGTCQVITEEKPFA